MSTTCSDIVARAQAFSPSLNAPLASDSSVMLSRIRADQSSLYAKVADVNRNYFATTATITSSLGSTNRVFDVSGLTPPVERVLKLVLADGREVSEVDPLDTDAELSPRFTVQGQTLREVGGDWGNAGSAISATLTYVQAPTPIDPTGTLGQAVSLADRWTDLLVLPLAMYLAQSDVGRDPAEIARLQSLADARLATFLDHVAHQGGVMARRFVYPTPNSGKL